MDIFEFELRYNAYSGLNYKFDLWRDLDTVINLVKITDKWKTDKKLQEITPAEIHELTVQTYTNFKKDFIEKNKDKLLYPDKDFTLVDYINRLEYELKVIKQMWFNTYFLIVADYVG